MQPSASERMDYFHSEMPLIRKTKTISYRRGICMYFYSVRFSTTLERFFRILKDAEEPHSCSHSIHYLFIVGRSERVFAMQMLLLFSPTSFLFPFHFTPSLFFSFSFLCFSVSLSLSSPLFLSFLEWRLWPSGDAGVLILGDVGVEFVPTTKSNRAIALHTNINNPTD